MVKFGVYLSFLVLVSSGICDGISDVTDDNVNENLLVEITGLKKEIAALQKKVAELESAERLEAAPVEFDYASTNHVLSKRAALRRRLRRIPEIAFQASLQQESATFKLYDAIIFNDVITNIGRAYNKHNGVFTAAMPGTYSFYTNIVAEKGHYVEASIQVNDRATVSAISDHRVSSNRHSLDIWDQGNAVAILRLHKGDKVSVTIQWPQGSHDIHGVGKSSFSGYLLRAHV